jgi:SM-20-related protein
MKIRIIDDALDDFPAISKYVLESPFRYGWKSQAGSATSHWNRPFTANVDADARQAQDSTLAVHPLVSKAWERIKTSYMPGAKCIRAYSNLMTYGQDGSPHLDSNRDDDYTAMVYCNTEWKPEWAGETCFIDHNSDTFQAVLPKPNRLVIFPANVLHVARGIYPTTPVARVVLVFKATYE